jgi:carboxypeptidase C (cathepsin A)
VRVKSSVLVVLSVAGFAFPAAAAEIEGGGEHATAVSLSAPLVFSTSHSGRFGGRTVDYSAIAGETILLDEESNPKASFFSFAYVEEGIEDPSQRPVAFLWNGGPGSSSIWLHMGAMGPRRAVVPSDAGDVGPPPFTVEDNELALLDVTDLVFIDPVGTGFSRAVGTHENAEFWGLEADTASVAEFIRTWLTRNGRWMSPKYLIGESFGTVRAAAVATHLQDKHYLSVNGIILISQALDYTGSTPVHDNLIAYVSYLPTMAATAWYHGKVSDPPGSLEELLDDVRRFAVEEYAPALLAGNHLAPETRREVAKKLARYTGLSQEYVELADLRVLAARFRKELLRTEGLSVGRADGRYTGHDVDRTSERPDGDPSHYKVRSSYAAALNEHLTRDLDVTMDREYKFSGGRELSRHWNWRTVPDDRHWEPSFVNVARDLSRTMRHNAGMRVMVASGYYDFATPFFDAELTFARHGFVADRIRFTYYEAGHMMYLHRPSLDALMADIREFMAE